MPRQIPKLLVIPGPPQAEPGIRDLRHGSFWIPGSRSRAPRNDA
jgi:hypothetical protein